MTDVQIPATKETAPTQKMIDLLKKHNLWKDGMTMEEASNAIDTLPKSNYVKEAGLYPMKVTEINASDKKNRNGNPCFEVIFETKEGEIARDYFYYPASASAECKSEWKLNAFKGALGFAAASSPRGSELIGKILWVGIGWVQYVDENKNLLKNEDGSLYGFTTCIGKYIRYAKGEVKPSLQGDPATTNSGLPEDRFYSEKLWEKKESSTSAPAPQEQSAPKQETGDSEESDW